MSRALDTIPPIACALRGMYHGRATAGPSSYTKWPAATRYVIASRANKKERFIPSGRRTRSSSAASAVIAVATSRTRAATAKPALLYAHSAPSGVSCSTAARFAT